MLAHQLGRRNLTPLQASELRGRYKLLFGKNEKGKPKQSDQKIPQNAAIMTDKAIAEKHGVSVDTIQRDATFAKHIDQVSNAIGPEARVEILTSTMYDQQTTRKLATIAEASL